VKLVILLVRTTEKLFARVLKYLYSWWWFLLMNLLLCSDNMFCPKFDLIIFCVTSLFSDTTEGRNKLIQFWFVN